MVVGGLKKTTSRKAGGIPLVSTRFSLNAENEQANAGLDGRPCLQRRVSQARTGTREYFSFLADHEKMDWQPYRSDPDSA